MIMVVATIAGVVLMARRAERVKEREAELDRLIEEELQEREARRQLELEREKRRANGGER